ncbi:MAG TPA: ATP-dependent metallopeptidase FtsH/Yme1/Tma family protein, partial [Acidimicrobiales bacterium]|nr:ATP-dependent metallopeptidase FtsH/Yme1/Tma family protein [Acidimicrobiales bacterium]
MTKKAHPPPTPDKGTPTAPPPPPAWRHWLWLIALALFIVLYVMLPTTKSEAPVTLSYSQFMQKVSADQVKSVTLAATGEASGTLKNGKQYTTVVPAQAGQDFLSELQSSGAEVTAETAAPSLGADALSWLILLLPFVILGYLWWRLSKGAAGQMQGALGVGRSKAKIFDEERPRTTFADVAGYEGAKLEIREVVDFLRRPER